MTKRNEEPEVTVQDLLDAIWEIRQEAEEAGDDFQVRVADAVLAQFEDDEEE